MAELVRIASPNDLHATINHAKKIKMAHNFAASRQSGQQQGNPNRGHGGFTHGHGKFSAVQSQPTNNVRNQTVVNAGVQSRAQSSGEYGPHPLD